jgi:hypothetical protein
MSRGALEASVASRLMLLVAGAVAWSLHKRGWLD